MSEQNWKKYFIPPFEADTYDPGIIWDSSPSIIASSTAEMDELTNNDQEDTERAMRGVVDAMNAVCEGKTPATDVPFENPEYLGTHTNSIVKFKAFGLDMSFCVRGWGYLTGPSKLSSDDATKIQDEFGEFIVECIKATIK